MVEVLPRPIEQDPGIKTNEIQVNNLGVHYLSSGNPQNKPLLLFHGLGTDASLCFGEVMKPFADAGFFVVAPDFPGYGKSDSPNRFDTRAFVDFSYGFMDALDLENPHAVGLSFGGAVATGSAFHEPDRIDQLVLINSYGFTERTHVPIFDEIALFRALTSAFKEKATHLVFKAPVLVQGFLGVMRKIGESSKETTKFVVDRMLFNGSFITDEMVREFLQSEYGSRTDHTISMWLREEMGPRGPRTHFPTLFKDAPLAHPTLIVCGAKDRIIPPHWAQAANDHIAGSIVSVFEESGHGLPLQEPDRFISEVCEFLAA